MTKTPENNKMINKIRIVALILLSAVVVLLTGCWDRREINDVAFILTTALDLEPDGKFRVTMQIPLAGQLGGPKGGGGGSGGNKSYFIDSDTGRTIREAISKVQARSSRRLYSAHRRVIIVGEELARKRGIRDIFEAIARFPENRITAYMIVSKGKAADLLNTEPPLERFSGEAIREMAKAEGRIVINIKNVAQALSKPYSDPLLLYMGPKETEGSKDKKPEVETLGYAQFKQDKMVDTFEKDKANAISWLRKEPRPYDYVLHFGKESISLEMTEGRATINPVFSRDGSITFRIRAVGSVAVMENLSGNDLTDPVVFRQVTQAASDTLKDSMLAALHQIQKYKTDPLDLGADLWRGHPRVWESKYRHNWHDQLSQARFDLQVQMNIVQIGYISSNIAEVTRE
jgi:spore germination protein KC